jgi:hypothetical protein
MLGLARFLKADVLMPRRIFLLVQTFVYWRASPTGGGIFSPSRYGETDDLLSAICSHRVDNSSVALTVNPLWFIVSLMLAQQYIYGLVFLRLHR